MGIDYSSPLTRGSHCWIWTGAHATEGYGYFKIGSRTDGSRRNVRAHRVTYELVNGEIPEDLESDHLCRKPACVNPAHLELVTTRENQMRGINPQLNKDRSLLRTCCPNGHLYDEANTYYYRGYRMCRECKRLAGKNYEERYEQKHGHKRR